MCVCKCMCVHVCNYFRTTKRRYAKINIYFEAHLSRRAKAASEIFNQFADNAPQALSARLPPSPLLCSFFSTPLAPSTCPLGQLSLRLPHNSASTKNI